MSYKNGGDILPAKLLTEIQKYIQGEIIYIPKKNNGRAAWGELSGSKVLLLNRNRKIYSSFKQGLSVKELAINYCLSEDSIKKIIFKLEKEA